MSARPASSLNGAPIVLSVTVEHSAANQKTREAHRTLALTLELSRTSEQVELSAKIDVVDFSFFSDSLGLSEQC